MTFDELVFGTAYQRETLYLQQAWIADKNKKSKTRDNLFQKASEARPLVDLSDVCMCGKGICSLHWEKHLDSVNKNTV